MALKAPSLAYAHFNFLKILKIFKDNSMKKRLINIFFDRDYVDYDMFVSNNVIILVHKERLNIIRMNADDYLSTIKEKFLRCSYLEKFCL